MNLYFDFVNCGWYLKMHRPIACFQPVLFCLELRLQSDDCATTNQKPGWKPCILKNVKSMRPEWQMCAHGRLLVCGLIATYLLGFMKNCCLPNFNGIGPAPKNSGNNDSQNQRTFEESWQMTTVSPRVGFLQINIPSRNLDKWQMWINIPSKNRDKWQTLVLRQGSPDQHTFEESWQIDSTHSQNHKSIARPGPICMSSLWLVGLVILWNCYIRWKQF